MHQLLCLSLLLFIPGSVTLQDNDAGESDEYVIIDSSSDDAVMHSSPEIFESEPICRLITNQVVTVLDSVDGEYVMIRATCDGKIVEGWVKKHILDDAPRQHEPTVTPSGGISSAAIAAPATIGHGVPEMPGETEAEAPSESDNPLKILSSKGTGRTTGHIGTVAVKNTGDKPVRVTGQSFFIPSNGKHQSYAGSIGGGEVIGPGETAELPVHGYCTDVHKPPVPSGEPMQSPDTWVPVSLPPSVTIGDPPMIPEPMNPPPASGSEPMPVPVLPMPPADPFTPDDIPGIVGSPGYTPRTSEDVPDYPVIWPSTGTPVDGTVDINRDPGLTGPVVVQIVADIEDAADVIQNDETIVTPFSGTPERERESIIQQTIWITMGTLTGRPYKKDDFAANVYDQFETNTGVPVASLPEEDKEQVDAGVGDFWNAFVATGVEAKVLRENDDTPRTSPGESGTPGVTEPTDRRCVEFPVDPVIDSRTGYDLFADLYRRGILSSDFLNEMRNDRIGQRVRAVQAMHHSLQTLLSEQFNVFECDDEVAHSHPAQPFPQFPREEFFLQVDMCDPANADKDHLADFIAENADPEALEAWMEDFETAVENLGLWNPNERSIIAGFQSQINDALQDIADAYEEFQSDMHTSMALRYNETRAWNNLWSAVATIAAAAVSAGIGAGLGGAAAALVSACTSTTGFVFEHGMSSMGMDPQVAALVSSVITLTIGGASAAGQGFVQFAGEEIITTVPSSVTAEGINTMAQQNVQGYAMSMFMLNDEVWDSMIEELSDDYRQDAIDQFNAYRDEFRAEVERQVQELCEIYRSLQQLLPALEEAYDEALQWTTPQHWRDLWHEAMDASLDCVCCEYSDGTVGTGCVLTIPAF